MNRRALLTWRLPALSATSATWCFLTGSFAVLLVLAAVARHLRLISVPLPFDKGSLDVMLSDKTVDCLDNRRGHRYGRDQIVAGIGQSLALRGVNRYRMDIECRARRIRKP